jgi:hypothetical protein
MLVRVAQYCVQAPMIYEAYYWANLTDLAFVAGALTPSGQAPSTGSNRMACWIHSTHVLLLVVLSHCPLKAVIHECSDLIRKMMGLFYFGAGFWKLNTSFLDPRVSCGTMFVASHLVARVPESLRAPSFVAMALSAAPLLTIIGETSIGVCLLLPSRAAHRVGFILSNLLHFSICMTPYPNAVPLFGVCCYTRLFFAMPEAWTVALAEVFRMPSTAYGVAARAVAASLVAAVDPVDW